MLNISAQRSKFKKCTFLGLDNVLNSLQTRNQISTLRIRLEKKRSHLPAYDPLAPHWALRAPCGVERGFRNFSFFSGGRIGEQRFNSIFWTVLHSLFHKIFTISDIQFSNHQSVISSTTDEVWLFLNFFWNSSKFGDFWSKNWCQIQWKIFMAKPEPPSTGWHGGCP